MAEAKSVLYDVPVSNNGARIRIIILKKQLQDVIDIKSPAELGGASVWSHPEKVTQAGLQQQSQEFVVAAMNW